MANPTNLPQVITPMPLFPTMDSLQDVIDYGVAKLPIDSKNDLYSLLMSYHNTLLNELRG